LYKLVRRPPCWNSTARLARHARLDLFDLFDWLDKVERVESSRVEPSGILALWSKPQTVYSIRSGRSKHF